LKYWAGEIKDVMRGPGEASELGNRFQPSAAIADRVSPARRWKVDTMLSSASPVSRVAHRQSLKKQYSAD
jgi:hypothetical protein